MADDSTRCWRVCLPAGAVASPPDYLVSPGSAVVRAASAGNVAGFDAALADAREEPAAFVGQALVAAAEAGCTDIVARVLAFDSFWPGSQALTDALTKSARRGALGVVEALVEAGVDPAVQNGLAPALRVAVQHDLMSALREAVTHGHRPVAVAIVNRLLKEGPVPDVVLVARAAQGDAARVIEVLDGPKVDPSVMDNLPLQLSVITGCAAAVAAIMRHPRFRDVDSSLAGTLGEHCTADGRIEAAAYLAVLKALSADRSCLEALVQRMHSAALAFSARRGDLGTAMPLMLELLTKGAGHADLESDRDARARCRKAVLCALRAGHVPLFQALGAAMRLGSQCSDDIALWPAVLEAAVAARSDEVRNILRVMLASCDHRFPRRTVAAATFAFRLGPRRRSRPAGALALGWRQQIVWALPGSRGPVRDSGAERLRRGWQRGAGAAAA